MSQAIVDDQRGVRSRHFPLAEENEVLKRKRGRAAKPVLLQDGSPSRTRTYDRAINSRLLYQLSYRGSRGRYITGFPGCNPPVENLFNVVGATTEGWLLFAFGVC